MPYRVVITKIDCDVKYVSKDWKKLRDEEEKDPSGDNKLYGYVETEMTHDVSSEIFDQTVEELVVKDVVAVVNNIVREKE